jgi:hypothetical protein
MQKHPSSQADLEPQVDDLWPEVRASHRDEPGPSAASVREVFREIDINYNDEQLLAQLNYGRSRYRPGLVEQWWRFMVSFLGPLVRHELSVVNTQVLDAAAAIDSKPITLRVEMDLRLTAPAHARSGRQSGRRPNVSIDVHQRLPRQSRNRWACRYNACI